MTQYSPRAQMLAQELRAKAKRNIASKQGRSTALRPQQKQEGPADTPLAARPAERQDS